MCGQMNPIDEWFDALLRGEMETLIWKWKTAWGEVDKHSGLNRKILISLFHPASRVRLLFPWQHSWLHENCCCCGCHGNTSHYAGVTSHPASLHWGSAYMYTSPFSWPHAHGPLLVTWDVTVSEWQKLDLPSLHPRRLDLCGSLFKVRLCLGG